MIRTLKLFSARLLFSKHLYKLLRRSSHAAAHDCILPLSKKHNGEGLLPFAAAAAPTSIYICPVRSLHFWLSHLTSPFSAATYTSPHNRYWAAILCAVLLFHAMEMIVAVECRRAFRYYSWSSLHPCDFSVPTEFRLHHSRILQVKVSVCILAQAFFLDCILLCCITYPKTVNWKVCIFICVIQSSHLMIHSFSPTFYVSSPWRVGMWTRLTSISMF